MRRRSAEKWTRWRGLLCEQGESGQSVAAFCRDRGLRGSMFYKWKKRVEENDGAQFIEVKVAACREAVRAVPANSRAIEVRLNKGLKLVVEPGFDANHLRALLSVLEGEA